MPCPKCSDTLKRCPDGIESSDCIKYVGEDSVCDIFCKGQSVSEVVEAIDAEICTIKTNTDVSTIDLNDYCADLRDFYISKNYEDKTVVNFIDFLLSFDCNLQGQIDAINNSLTTFVPTVTIADWSCLKDTPCNVISTGIPLNTAIQNLVNTICDQNSRIETLETKTCQQQKTIDALVKSIEQCLIPKLNAIGDTLDPKINFGACQVTPNPNTPC